jgi:hypothetical protein
VSTPDKPDPFRGALFVAKLVAESEAERIEAQSDEEFLAEQKRAGHELPPTPSTGELLERLRARAARPSASGARENARAVAPVLLPRRPPRLLWLLAAALAVVLVAVIAGPTVVALLRGHP